MTNGEKYKTAQERVMAFLRYCDYKSCDGCELDEKRISTSSCNDHVCLAFWLDLEAEEEKPLPCPFCGNDKLTIEKDDYGSQVQCLYCGYRAIKCGVNVDPIDAHNRVAKKCREGKE